jgi:hypothetical protein
MCLLGKALQKNDRKREVERKREQRMSVINNDKKDKSIKMAKRFLVSSTEREEN